jgi:DNA-binding transcriptional MocR family regulator
MIRQPALRARGNYVSKSDMVTDALRELITDRQLSPGTPLRQRDLAEQFDVSYTPVREALRRLESEGLVVTDVHRGAPSRAPSRRKWRRTTDLGRIGSAGRKPRRVQDDQRRRHGDRSQAQCRARADHLHAAGEQRLAGVRGSLGVDRPAAPEQRAAERDGRCEQILGAGSERIDEHYDPGQA